MGFTFCLSFSSSKELPKEPKEREERRKKKEIGSEKTTKERRQLFPGMESLVQRFPVPCKNLSLDINGNKTELVICSYEDHFLVMASQIGTMGTILHARKEEGVSIHPTFNVSVIFGKRDEPMLVTCARQLIEHISSSGSSRSLVLSLGLKDHSMETMKGIVSSAIGHRLW